MFISTNPPLPNEAAGSSPRNVTQKEFSSTDSRKSAKVDKAIRDFEGLFLSMMIKELRQTSSEGGLFPGDSSDTYGGMFDMFLGKELAKGKGIGLESLFRTSAAVSQVDERMKKIESLVTRDKAIEGYRNEQLRAGGVATP